MYRGLIDHLAFVYGFICKGRGKVAQEELRAIADGTHAVVRNAPTVLGGEDEQEDDRKDLALAGKMDQQIEEATIFLLSLEVV